MSVSKKPAKVCEKYEGAKPTSNPAVIPPYSLVIFLTNRYAGITAREAMKAPIQKLIAAKGTLANKFTITYPISVRYAINGGYSALFPAGYDE